MRTRINLAHDYENPFISFSLRTNRTFGTVLCPRKGRSHIAINRCMTMQQESSQVCYEKKCGLLFDLQREQVRNLCKEKYPFLPRCGSLNHIFIDGVCLTCIIEANMDKQGMPMHEETKQKAFREGNRKHTATKTCPDREISACLGRNRKEEEEEMRISDKLVRIIRDNPGQTHAVIAKKIGLRCSGHLKIMLDAGRIWRSRNEDGMYVYFSTKEKKDEYERQMQQLQGKLEFEKVEEGEEVESYSFWPQGREGEQVIEEEEEEEDEEEAAHSIQSILRKLTEQVDEQRRRNEENERKLKELRENSNLYQKIVEQKEQLRELQEMGELLEDEIKKETESLQSLTSELSCDMNGSV